MASIVPKVSTLPKRAALFVTAYSRSALKDVLRQLTEPRNKTDGGCCNRD